MVSDLKNFEDCIESKVEGINLLLSGDLSISISNPLIGKSTLFAKGVAKLLISEFREQNIIDKINVWGAESEPSDYVEFLELLLGGRDEANQVVISKNMLESAKADIKSGKRLFVFIDAIYGAEFFMLVEKFSLNRT